MASQKTIRVLSIDGGGIRGVAVARILEEIEKVTKERIYKQFDVIVGTSTGGLLSILLSVPSCKEGGQVMKAKTAKELYIEQGSHIFPKPYNPSSLFSRCLYYLVSAVFFPFTLYKMLTLPKYSEKGLRGVIAKCFREDVTLEDARTNVGVVATDIQYGTSILLNSLRAKLYPDDYRHNAALSDIIRATSAAPTYLAPVILKDIHRERRKARYSVCSMTTDEPEYKRRSLILEDGGTSHNNPAKIGMKYAKTYLKSKGLNPRDFKYQLVSIGTGTLTGKQTDPTENPVHEKEGWKCSDGGLDNVIQRILFTDVFDIAVKSYEVHCKVQDILGKEEGPGSNYFRVQFKVDKHQLKHLDDVSKTNTDSLIASAEAYLFSDKEQKVYTPHFLGLLNMLEQEVIRPEHAVIYQADQEQEQEQEESANLIRGASERGLPLYLQEKQDEQLLFGDLVAQTGQDMSNLEVYRENVF